jgi:hypothetical protein
VELTSGLPVSDEEYKIMFFNNQIIISETKTTESIVTRFSTSIFFIRRLRLLLWLRTSQILKLAALSTPALRDLIPGNASPAGDPI